MELSKACSHRFIELVGRFGSSNLVHVCYRKSACTCAKRERLLILLLSSSKWRATGTSSDIKWVRFDTWLKDPRHIFAAEVPDKKRMTVRRDRIHRIALHGKT